LKKLSEAFKARNTQNEQDSESFIDNLVRSEGVCTRAEFLEQERERLYGFQLSVQLDDSELTDEDRAAIRKTMFEQKQRFRLLERRDRRDRITRVKSVYPNLTNEEIIYTLRNVQNNIEEAVIKLTSFTFLQEIRKRIALDVQQQVIAMQNAKEGKPIHFGTNGSNSNTNSNSNGSNGTSNGHSNAAQHHGGTNSNNENAGSNNGSNNNRSSSRNDDDDEDMEDDNENDADYGTSKKSTASSGSKKRKADRSANSSSSNNNNNNNNNNNGENNDENDDGDDINSSAPKGKRPRLKRLKLDEAIKKGTTGNFDGWSEARVKSWKLVQKNPNAYYYRFNAPGEAQKNGGWNKREREIFMNRLKECSIIGCDSPQWGVFAMAIEGRVGYQCANFYRQLIKKGEVQDPNYWVDENGEVHCRFGKGCRKRKSKSDAALAAAANGSTSTTPVSGKAKRGRKKKAKDDDDDVIRADEVSGDESGNEADASQSASQVPAVASSSPDENSPVSHGNNDNNSSMYITNRYNQNPLPGFKDVITMEEIEQPAISPYGHVLGFRTWLRILQREPKNTCPFTKQAIQKRDLIRLTLDNIDEHRPKIKNME